MTDSKAVVHARIRWTIACCRQLLAHARDDGWSTDDVPAPSLSRDEARAAVEHATRDAEAAPFDLLRARFGISATELDALWLLVCFELEPALAQITRSIGAPDGPDVSVATWQRILECAGIGALDRGSIERLDQLGLIETTHDPRLPAYRRWIRAADRVVDLARGDRALDREVAEIAALEPPDELAARASEVLPELHSALTSGALIVATGADGSGRSTLLARIAARAARGVLRVRCGDLAIDPDRLARQLRGVARECRLLDVVPLLEDADALFEAGARTDRIQVVERQLCRAVSGPMLATTRTDCSWQLDRPVVSHRMRPTTAAERGAIWRGVLPGCDREVHDAVASGYTVTPGMSVAAARSALARAGDPAHITMSVVHEGLRAHVDQRLGRIATRTICTQRWDDLVLPADQLEQIVELVARVKHRRTVLEDWGFAGKVGRGLGLAALMSGPPGTGKTMIAGLIANELQLDLYQVDVSRVVSKYIGETEKNLALVFDAAESGHSILLFDEADSLFAKRSEVRSSNDRYANLEVNYLLQRIEQFTGISILTTNHEATIDEALRRRIAIHVRFPIPDEDQRELLWRAMLPEHAAIGDGIDFRRLAEGFAMAGGYIKNAALRAAYLAANGRTSIGMQQLWRAARAEYEAMGKVAHQAAP